MQKRSGPAGKDRADVQLPGELGFYTVNTPKTQARTGPAPLHILMDRCVCTRPGGKCQCVPRVATVRKDNTVFVGVINPPWGFRGNRLREFIGGTGKAANAYAIKLRDELRELAWKEYDRRAARKAAQMREWIEASR